MREIYKRKKTKYINMLFLLGNSIYIQIIMQS
jgi:hypothetical protein